MRANQGTDWSLQIDAEGDTQSLINWPSRYSQAGFGPRIVSVERVRVNPNPNPQVLMLKMLCFQLTSHHHPHCLRLLSPLLQSITFHDAVVNLTMCENEGWVSFQSFIESDDGTSGLLRIKNYYSFLYYCSVQTYGKMFHQ